MGMPHYTRQCVTAHRVQRFMPSSPVISVPFARRTSMDQQQRAARQRQIAAELHVADHFDPAPEIERRVAFLADYLRTNGLAAYVLGISGGVDSSTAGRL